MVSTRITETKIILRIFFLRVPLITRTSLNFKPILFGEDPITIDQLMRLTSLTKKKDLTVLLDFIGDYEL